MEERRCYKKKKRNIKLLKNINEVMKNETNERYDKVVE